MLILRIMDHLCKQNTKLAIACDILRLKRFGQMRRHLPLFFLLSVFRFSQECVFYGWLLPVHWVASIRVNLGQIPMPLSWWL